MATGPLDTTRTNGSLDILTPDTGGTPQYLIDGIPVIGTMGLIWKIIEVDSNYIADGSEDAIFATGPLTVTLIDSATAVKPTLVRSMAGTITVASVSPVSDTTITTGISRNYYPISTGWESA